MFVGSEIFHYARCFVYVVCVYVCLSFSTEMHLTVGSKKGGTFDVKSK